MQDRLTQAPARLATELGHVTIKSPEEQEEMRVAGRLAADVLDMIGPHVMPGVTTDELDQSATTTSSSQQQAIPANVNYRGFPKTICTSVNHVVCHGIPNDKKLKPGDIVNIDVTVIQDGFHGDTSRMYYVGKPAAAAAAPVRVSCEAMWRGIEQVRPGARLGDIGHAIQTFVEGERFLGRARILRPWHRPRLPRGPAGAALRRAAAPALELEAGMTFTIEPMVNAGKRARAAAAGWLDRGHQGPLAVGAVGTHGPGHATGFEVLTLGAGEQRARRERTAWLRSKTSTRAAIHVSHRPWPFLATLPSALAATAARPPRFPRGAARMATRAQGSASPRTSRSKALVRDRARAHRRHPAQAWQLHCRRAATTELALLAVGGYGRGELHPHSDVDILILVPRATRRGRTPRIERFVTFLWDIGLEVGHSVRTVDECAEESAADVGVMTTLLEARLLAGPDRPVRSDARGAGARTRVWPSKRVLRGQGAPSSRSGTSRPTTPPTTSNRM